MTMKTAEEECQYTCQICFASGNDMRTLRLSWMVAVQEYIPEAIEEMGNGYKLRTCKTCRAGMLEAMAAACINRRELRKYELTPDGDEILTRYVLKGEEG
jgi:hypothetical protein